MPLLTMLIDGKKLSNDKTIYIHVFGPWYIWNIAMPFDTSKILTWDINNKELASKVFKCRKDMLNVKRMYFLLRVICDKVFIAA